MEKKQKKIQIEKDLKKIQDIMKLIKEDNWKQRKQKKLFRKEMKQNERNGKRFFSETKWGKRELKQNELIQNGENVVEDVNVGRFLELATTNELYVNRLNFHEFIGQILEDYTGNFEMIGSMLIAEKEQRTNIRFKNIDDFEACIRAIGVNYDSEEVIFKGWLNKLKTCHFIRVNRAQYGIGTDFKQDFVENISNNCYIPTSGNCFIKCNNDVAGREYADKFSTFIRTEKRRSNFRTSARIQAFCGKHNIIIGCYEGFRVCPRSITERSRALFMFKNHFCLVWKYKGVSFTKAIEELK